MDGWYAQIASSILLASGTYGVKMGIRRLKHRGKEPVSPADTLSEAVIRPLNRTQRGIISVMVAIMAYIAVKAVTTAMFYRPYEWSATWWVWLLGLGALTAFEVWFWRDST